MSTRLWPATSVAIRIGITADLLPLSCHSLSWTFGEATAIFQVGETRLARVRMSTLERQTMMLWSNSGKRKTFVEAGVGITFGSVGGADTARWNDMVKTVVKGR